jgi:hypothetical protein
MFGGFYLLYCNVEEKLADDKYYIFLFLLNKPTFCP